jgi:tetratricopeptide (TPR) repeat protein
MLVGICLIITGFLLFLFISNRNKYKNIKDDILNETKKLVKVQDLDHDSFYSEMEKGTVERIKDFDSALENNYHKLLDTVNRHLDKKVEEFRKQIQTAIKNSGLNSGEINESGVKDTLQQEKISELIEQELSVYLKNLVNTEKQIIYNIQKVHLANHHLNMGNMFFKRKQYTEAIEEFKEAIKVDGYFYGAYINLGKTLEKNSLAEDAVKAYKHAIQIKPDYYKAYFNLANLLFSKAKLEEAIEIYKKAIELKPDYFKAYNNLGITYQKLNQLAEAKDQFQKAIYYNKDYPDAYYNLSNVDRALRKDKSELYTIAEMYMKKFNASNETSNIVKQLIKN